MKCIIGLGNPESKYLNTKHNFGFWIVDKIIEERSLKYKAGKGDYVCAIDKQHMFVKPTTFVNNSGVAIQQMLKVYNNLNIKDIIVIYDDININLGNIRFKSSGADGGHNGIKSIIYQLQIDIFDRLKKRKKSNTKPVGFIVGSSNIYLTIDNGRLIIIDILSGKSSLILKIDNEKISRPFILNKNLFIIKDNAIIKIN